MRKIKLTQGKWAIVDDEDFDRLSEFRWQATRGLTTWYAKRSYYIKGSSPAKWGIELMHRVVIDAKPGMLVDHINHNGLDNRKENLRACSTSQNQGNRRKSKSNKSGYKGVAWHPLVNKWEVRIRKDRRQVTIGYFTNKKAAARAYDEAATRLFGEYALLNLHRRQSNL